MDRLTRLPVSLPHVYGKNGPILYIPGRTLEYGAYVVTLKVRFPRRIYLS